MNVFCTVHLVRLRDRTKNEQMTIDVHLVHLKDQPQTGS